MTPKISEFLRNNSLESPFLVVDLDMVERNYRRLHGSMPSAEIFYAVKANPAPALLSRLVQLGSSFDAASIREIETCLTLGAGPRRISFGNTVKKSVHIARAYEAGIDLYAFDAAEELKKLAKSAPGSRVFCRIALDNEGAEWPLGQKFGCSLDMARDLMLEAGERGLVPHGISFHVGSQQCDVRQWDIAIGKTAMLFWELADRGVDVRMVNLGGGFPVQYRRSVPSLEAIGGEIKAALSRHFGNRMPDVIIEPGRSIAADAGVLRAEVVLIAHKNYGDDKRWVYLDIGKFGGLAETQAESIQYRFRTPHDGGANGPGGDRRADVRRRGRPV